MSENHKLTGSEATLPLIKCPPHFKDVLKKQVSRSCLMSLHILSLSLLECWKAAKI